MQKSPPKPDDYDSVSTEKYKKIHALYREFKKRDAIATHAAYSELYDIQQKYRRAAAREARAMQRIWDNYDLYSRAILFLTVRAGGDFDRVTLRKALNADHNFTAEQIESYKSAFPESLYAYHCDLGMTVGEKYRLTIPRPHVSLIESVIPDFAYYVVDSLMPNYYTLWDGQLILLPTTDYECDFEHDRDGLCEYIQ